MWNRCSPPGIKLRRKYRNDPISNTNPSTDRIIDLLIIPKKRVIIIPIKRHDEAFHLSTRAFASFLQPIRSPSDTNMKTMDRVKRTENFLTFTMITAAKASMLEKMDAIAVIPTAIILSENER